MLLKDWVDVNAGLYDGSTLIHFAAHRQYEKIVNILLNSKQIRCELGASEASLYIAATE